MAQHPRPGIDFIGITTPFYCNDGNGLFVLHKRSNSARDENGRWDFGAGQLEFGEEVEKGMLRELYEEYGVGGVIQEQVPAHSIIRSIDGIQTHWLAIPFFVKIDVTKARIMERKHFTEIGVFPFHKFPEPFHTGAQTSMQKYKDYFAKYAKA